MAASAAEAQALVRVWNLAAGSGALSDEAKLFIGWQAEFNQRCRNQGWIDLAGLHRQLVSLIEAGHFALPATVIFAGFDRFTPLERDLMAALATRGIPFENQPNFPVDRGNRDSRLQVAGCADSDAECAAVVAWVQAQLAANPGSRLGIVAPDLAGVRDRLEFLLDDALHPALIRPDAAETPRCFNFSLGRVLADLPLIRVALDLLALGSGRAKIEQRRLSELLLAGGWSAGKAKRMVGPDSIAPCAVICRISPRCRPSFASPIVCPKTKRHFARKRWRHLKPWSTRPVPPAASCCRASGPACFATV
jgi:exodeoxyribonuclease-5